MRQHQGQAVTLSEELCHCDHGYHVYCTGISFVILWYPGMFIHFIVYFILLYFHDSLFVVKSISDEWGVYHDYYDLSIPLEVEPTKFVPSFLYVFPISTSKDLDIQVNNLAIQDLLNPWTEQQLTTNVAPLVHRRPSTKFRVLDLLQLSSRLQIDSRRLLEDNVGGNQAKLVKMHEHADMIGYGDT